MQEINDDLHKLATALTKLIVKFFKENAAVEFSNKPQLKREFIREFNKKMRIYGVEKFSAPTFVSTVNYYKNLEDLQNSRPLGVLIVYIIQDYVSSLLKSFNYPDIDDSDDNALKDACGTLCNVIAGRFKAEISSMGFIELEMSHFTNYLNTSLRGVDYCVDQPEKYEITFEIYRQKKLVVEMSMGAIPRIY